MHDITYKYIHRCETGQYRIECKILIFLNADLNTIIQKLSMTNISVASLIPLANTESISGYVHSLVSNFKTLMKEILLQQMDFVIVSEM